MIHQTGKKFEVFSKFFSDRHGVAQKPAYRQPTKGANKKARYQKDNGLFMAGGVSMVPLVGIELTTFSLRMTEQINLLVLIGVVQSIQINSLHAMYWISEQPAC